MLTPERRARLRELAADSRSIFPSDVIDLLDALDAAEQRAAELEQRLSDDAAIAAVLTLSAAMEDEEILSQEYKLDRMGL